MAINISRSPRKPFVKPSNPSIGPGSYNPDVRPAVEVNPAPFHSLQEKHVPNKTTPALTPGPGAYKVASSAKAGTTHGFKSMSARLAPQTPGSTTFSHSTMVSTPGPGTYSYTKAWAEPKTESPERGKPILELSKTVASIPHRRVSAGVSFLGEEGQATEDKKDAAAPESEKAKKDGRSTNFHTSGTGRNLFKSSCSIHNVQPSPDVPGPGSYDHGSSTQTQGFSNVFVSKTPMCHQLPADEKPDFPLEGTRVAKPLGGDGPAAAHTFQSQVQRTGWNRSLEQPFKDSYSQKVPGPGHYYTHDADPPEPKKKQVRGVHHPNQVVALNDVAGPLHAFNTTDIRPCNKDIVGKDTPAPGQYNIEMANGHTISAALQEKALVGKKGVFGTTTDRFFRSQFDSSSLAPGADGVDGRNYDPGNRSSSKEETTPRRSMAFKSTTRRFSNDPPKAGQAAKQETPAPTHYDPNTEINYRSPFRTPRVEHLSFGTGSTRFNPKEVFQGIQHDMRPGPGEYSARSSRKVPGSARSRAKRTLAGSIGCTSHDIGPGSYETTSTMLKKSFNVT